MRYDEFKALWNHAIREARLPVIGSVHETLDLGTMDRTYETCVHVIASESGPFSVTATLSWCWDVYLLARSSTTEEDLLSDLLGKRSVDKIRTDQPLLRVDITLRASSLPDKPIRMPSKSVLSRWVYETLRRIDQTQAPAPKDRVRRTKEGREVFLAWIGEPVLKTTCDVDGGLKLDSVELSSWQAIDLPRQWDNPDRKNDESPHEQLSQMFGRLGTALGIWALSSKYLADEGVDEREIWPEGEMN